MEKQMMSSQSTSSSPNEVKRRNTREDNDEHHVPADATCSMKPPQRQLNLRSRFTMRGPRREQGTIQNPVVYSSFLCGLLAGVAQAGVFNPYDRALYISVKERCSFLSWSNWRTPYNGFFQSLGGRALAGGLYFPLEHFFLRVMDPLESSPLRNLVAGTAAGAVNAIFLNPLSAIKYKTWGKEVNHGMMTTASLMLQKAGSIRPFLNGVLPTIYRDLVFGGCYTWLRLQIQVWYDLSRERQWQANLIAAALATMASAPFNYARNIQYATPSSEKALSTQLVLEALVVEMAAQPTVLQQLKFLAHRLRIGWGTARVALGMSFGHAVYDWLHTQMQSLHYLHYQHQHHHT